jgi:L-lactate dehydrogenase complex protein LldE
MSTRVALLPTCVVDALLPEVGVAVVQQLRRYGCEVDVPRQATCCGQPAWNAGHVSAAAAVARTTLRALAAAGAEAVVVPAGSCTAMIRVFWPELFRLAGDAAAVEQAQDVAGKTCEFSEFLAKQQAEAGGGLRSHGREPAQVVYHHSCHMLRELGIERQPEALLLAAGVESRESAARGRCCGFGGLFSVKLPEASVAMADDILDAAAAEGASEIVGCDSSCLLHLAGRAARRDLTLRCRHLAQLLEERA